MARLTPAETETIRAAVRDGLAEGATQQQIADRIGRSRSLVQKIAQELGDAEPRHKRNAVPVTPAGARAKAGTARGPIIQGAYNGTAAMKTVIPPPDHYSRWAEIGLDMNAWDTIETSELVRILTNMSPDVSRAVWDWLQMLDPGHEITAYRPGTDTQDKRAQAAVDAFVAVLEDHYGSMKVLTARLFMGAIMRGAFVAELVLDRAGRMPIDLVIPDPISLRFRRVEDRERGQVWQMGQWQGGTFVVIDSPTVGYIPVHPEPDSPYGRPMLSAAVFPSIFLIGLMHDLRRVVAQQGYPRTELILDLEKLKAAYDEGDDDAFAEMVGKVQADLLRAYAGLQPDDAFAHTNDIEVKTATGAIDTGVLEGVESMIEALERMAMRALKTTPLMMGLTDGMSEANANRQWEIYAAGAKSLQHLAETILARRFEVALEAQGIAADVTFQFAELRAAEELRDAQTMNAKLMNAILARDQGFIDQDEAAMMAVGHAPAAEGPTASETPEPEEDDTVGTSKDGDEAATEDNPDPGSEKSARVDNVRLIPEPLPYVPVADVTDADLRRASGVWDEAFAGTKYEGMLGATVEPKEGA